MLVVVTIIIIIVIVIQLEKRSWDNAFRIVNYAAAPVKPLLPVPQKYKDILQKYFRYYQKLSVENKAKFARRVHTFVAMKQFIPRNFAEVTLEAKVLIAASAVQLTFGLPSVYLRHFDKILVYPDNYYSSITKHFHKGEVNPAFGIIVLSWKSVVEGYINPQTSVNVGLHEMAHALRLENLIRNAEHQFFDPEDLERFDSWAEKICSSSSGELPSFFRPYACVDVHEFFAVAVENFFERSEQFRNELPELYGIMVRLLAQDPLVLG